MVRWLADSSGFSFDPSYLLNFGVLGIVVIALITGWLWVKPSVDRLIEERDRLIQERDKTIAQRDAMADVLQDKLLPVVGDFISTTRTLIPILQQIQQLQQMIPVLQDLVRRMDEYPPPQAPSNYRPRSRRRDPPADSG